MKAAVDEKVVLSIRRARKYVVRTHCFLRREIDDDDAVLQLFTRFAVELLKTGAQKIERPLEKFPFGVEHSETNGARLRQVESESFDHGARGHGLSRASSPGDDSAGLHEFRERNHHVFAPLGLAQVRMRSGLAPQLREHLADATLRDTDGFADEGVKVTIRLLSDALLRECPGKPRKVGQSTSSPDGSRGVRSAPRLGPGRC